MTLLTRWDPFRDFSLLQDRMNRLFQEYTPSGEEQFSTTNFVPPVDVYEDEHHVTLKAELPGVNPKDVDIRIENNVLTVRGERKFEKDEKEENFHRIERRYGSFYRAFTLPSTVDSEHINASYTSGVLVLELSKKAEAQPRQIKVSVGGQAKLENQGQPNKSQEPELVGAR